MNVQKFSQKDADMIVQCLANQPLQNLNAARNLEALIGRFQAFVRARLGEDECKVPLAK